MAKATETPDAPTTPEASYAPEAQMGFRTETFEDPRAKAINEAARRDYFVRQNPGEWVRLANGAAVRAQPGIMPSYDITPKETKMLGNPGGVWIVSENRLMMVPETSMILKTALKPPYYDQFGELIGPRYAWRLYNTLDPKDMRTAETRQLHRQKRIRYVEVAEIDKNCPFAVYVELPAGDTAYVQYFSQILCEILDVNLAYTMCKQGLDRAVERSRSAPRDIAQSPSLGEGIVTSVPGKFGMKLDVTEIRQGG